MREVRIQEFTGDDEAGLALFRTLDPPGPDAATRPGPGVRLLVVGRDEDMPAARAALRMATDLAGAPGQTGMIGQYEARDGEAGTALLRESTRRLAAAGAERVVGPMDGSTWHRYRLALPTPEAGPTPPFFTEPVNPPDYPSHFEKAGLAPVAHYVSQLVDDLDALEDRTREVQARLGERGLSIETLDTARYDATLDELHALSLAAFAGNAFYSPIDRDAFRALYEPLRTLLDPELVLLARNEEGTAQGFVLALPDLLDPAARYGQRPTRAVVKSLAVAPWARGSGLASLLVHEAHRQAAARGYRAAIHALMHVDNASLRISRHGGVLYRRYALFGRDL